MTKRSYKGRPMGFMHVDKTGMPFRDTVFVVLRTIGTNMILSAEANTTSVNSAGDVNPFNLLDPLASLSTAIQPYGLDQMYAIWSQAAVVKTDVLMTFRQTNIAAHNNLFANHGFYIICILTPSGTSDPVINQADLESAGTRAPELLKHHSQHSKMIKWRYVGPIHHTGAVERVPQWKIRFHCDNAMVQNTDPKHFEDDDNNLQTASAAPTNNPALQFLIMSGDGTAVVANADKSFGLDIEMRHYCIFSNRIDQPLSAQ